MADEEVLVEETVEAEEVDVTNLSDEELNKALSDEPEEVAEEDAKEQPEVKDAEPEKKEAKKTEAVTETTEEKAVVEDEEKVKLKKMLEDKELFIQRQANLLGDLKKKLEVSAPKPLTEDDLASMSQVEAYKALQQQEQAEVSHKEDLAELQGLYERQKRQEYLASKIPEFDSLKDDIVNTFVEDGWLEKELAPTAVRDIYKINENDLFLTAKSVLLKREMAKLKDELKAKDDKIAELSKKPGDVIKKIKKAASETEVTADANSSLSETEPELSAKDIEHMSESQLNDLLAKISKKR